MDTRLTQYGYVSIDGALQQVRLAVVVEGECEYYIESARIDTTGQLVALAENEIRCLELEIFELVYQEMAEREQAAAEHYGEVR